MVDNLSGITIYDEIESSISGFLVSEYSLTSGQILTESEVPDIDEEFFTRFVWTYGNLNDISNLSIQELPNLNIEVYERKNNGKNTASALVRHLRYDIKRDFNIKLYNGVYVKINNVYISRLDNDPEFYSFNITISFRIIQER